MKSLAVTIFALSTLSAVSAPTVAQTPLGPPVTWSVAAGGNGHSYQVFGAPGGISWSMSSFIATSAGGYLATITSAAENAFVFSLIGGVGPLWTPNAGGVGAYGPWIGGAYGGSA